jgi:hypothetical protein
MCMDNVAKMFIKIIIIPIAFLNLAIVFELLHPKLNACFQFFKNLRMTCPNNNVSPITEGIELQTISHAIDSTIQHNVISSNHNVTFTTGFNTIILATVGAGLVLKVTNLFELPFYTSAVLPCYALFQTTFISIYWVMANQELKEFACQVFRRIVRGRYQNN